MILLSRKPNKRKRKNWLKWQRKQVEKDLLLLVASKKLAEMAKKAGGKGPL